MRVRDTGIETASCIPGLCGLSSNLKRSSTVRCHHLLKTFHCGAGGWSEQQLPDGTNLFTTPSGRVHTTEPFGAMLFPQLAVPTGELRLPEHPPPDQNRGLKMPKRKRTRAQDRAYRIQRERNINAARYAADPPPF